MSTDFDISITASATGSGGYQYSVSETTATDVEAGWWYFVVVEFGTTEKVSNDQKDGAAHDPVDGCITIDSTNCGHKSSRQKRHKHAKVTLYRCKIADKYDKGRGNKVLDKSIEIKLIK